MLTGPASRSGEQVKFPPLSGDRRFSPRRRDRAAAHQRAGPTSTQTALATVFFLADAQATVKRLYNGGDPHFDSTDCKDGQVHFAVLPGSADRIATSSAAP
jgi:hypothetical protein